MGLKMKMLLVLVSLMMCETGYAAWTGPIEVLSGAWGNSPGQFAIEYYDSGDGFPRAFCVNSMGVIAIADEFNSRVQTYKSDGSRIASFGPQSMAQDVGWRFGWPLRIGCLANGVYTEFDKYTQIYDHSGVLIKSWDNILGGFIEILPNDSFVSKTSSAYYLYSPTGQLIKTSTERPLELGTVKSKPMGENSFKITITYPDRVYGLTTDREFMRYTRDAKGFVYGVNAGGAWRFNLCGKLTGAVLMPPPQITTIPSEGRGEPDVTIHEEYGEPVIAPNGDVYTWKRTPTAYSILKWTWVDDPNLPANVPDAPEKLTLKIASAGINLFWQAVPQDPGCVTGYEVVRSTVAGGPYLTLATVNAGTANAVGTIRYTDTTVTAGTTYYYKVRAIAGTEYSSYSPEVSGKK